MTWCANWIHCDHTSVWRNGLCWQCYNHKEWADREERDKHARRYYDALNKRLEREAREEAASRAAYARDEQKWARNLTVSKHHRLWRNDKGVIRFSVTSDGRTGKEWIKHLETRKIEVCDSAKEVLLSSGFKPTRGVKTNIAVFRGKLLVGEKFKEDYRWEKDERVPTKWNGRRLVAPSPEVAPLILDKFSGSEIEKMDLSFREKDGFSIRESYIVVMHESISGIKSGDEDEVGSLRVEFRRSIFGDCHTKLAAWWPPRSIREGIGGYSGFCPYKGGCALAVSGQRT